MFLSPLRDILKAKIVSVHHTALYTRSLIEGFYLKSIFLKLKGSYMSKTIYQISEYGSFITGRQIEGYTTLPPTIFEQLENFILSSKNVSSTHTFHKFFGTSSDTNALELMGISFRKEIGKIITAKNYIGVITFDDGTAIEILPKIVSNNSVRPAPTRP